MIRGSDDSAKGALSFVYILKISGGAGGGGSPPHDVRGSDDSTNPPTRMSLKRTYVCHMVSTPAHARHLRSVPTPGTWEAHPPEPSTVWQCFVCCRPFHASTHDSTQKKPGAMLRCHVSTPQDNLQENGASKTQKR